RAGAAKGSLQRLLDAFARHNHEAEIVERKNLRRRLVALQCFLQSLHHTIAIAAVFHVNQVEHDDAAEVAQANLANDFINGFEVGARDGVFQTRAAATDELARVDINGDERLRLIDDEIAAGFQPDARLDAIDELDDA